ncbi:condensation domain-containing protein [Streptomyces sp. NBC_00162]|uniref:condensation domain-containing protein n=1 Tax=Streptomyces sp. NBC_00162 TaxID=2903629 RepID=UPI00214B7E4E|nr:condensation domain-containing protein [Streptomyces sp. NBC_00162]UUU45000.1 condensation domain-containing protein [Streptomyces sp. NBC_00162]
MAAPVTVIVTPGPPPSLDLHGPLTQRALEAALAALPPCTPTLHRHTETHHTLQVPPPPFPAGVLADLLAAPRSEDAAPRPRGADDLNSGPPGEAGAPEPVQAAAPAAPLQRDVLLDALARPGAGLHAGQVYWRWHGPLDVARFTAAWQSLADREAVLRAALAPPVRDAGPQIAVHPHAAVEILRHRHDATDWSTLLVAERARAFDLRHPGPLRIALLDDPPPGEGGARSTRILITYHQALLDSSSVRTLLGAFYRAYLADGRVPGGERRPDVRDHLHWLHAQNLGPARAFWSRAAPSPDAATLPARPAARTTGGLGHGRSRLTLTAAEAVRLREWAAQWGATESTALHAAWALQLYRPSADLDANPRSVAFAVSVSGRGIFLEGVEALPGPLHNPLPVQLVVDPAATVSRLLADLTCRALDAAAYEWVSAGQIQAWAGTSPDAGRLTESLIVFEPPAQRGHGYGENAYREDVYREELAAEGIRVDPPETVGPLTGVPFTLAARHEADGSLVLTAVHDRTRFSDNAAALILSQTAGLLRELPFSTDGLTTVAEALGLLSGARVPPVTIRPTGALRLLREAAHPGAGTICLIPPPDAPPDCYGGLADLHPGPEALATLTAPADAADFLTGLRPVLATGEPLVLGCFSGAGTLACEIADRIAAHGWYPPLVVIAGAADGGPDSARALTGALNSATARPG